MSDAVLRMDAMTVVRDGAILLSGIDWTVAEGERWVVLGPNGAGKTTLLSVAASRQYPTSGRVEILGGQLGRTNIFDLRARIGLSSATLADALPADETVLDVVRTAAWSVVGRGYEQYDAFDTDRAIDLLAQLGCSDLVTRRFGTLSEGERKRVQIARSLMTDPELLLLDEPAAGLDLGAREALLRRLGRLAVDPAGPVLVMVSHHVEEIPLGVTHALLLRGGRIVGAGPVATTLTAQGLSACFGLPLEINVVHGRYSARLAFPSTSVRAAQPA
ncbi:MAG: ABC transporter ATP-binding protein [Frankia sp.]